MKTNFDKWIQMLRLVSLSVYFMKAVFGQNLDSAVLLAPPTQFNGSVCLQFQYRLSHPKIILSVQTTSLSNSLSTQKLMELNYRLQSNASDWNAANVTLNGTEDELQQVAFVAEKIGFTVELEYAAIRNIVITNSSCSNQVTNTLWKRCHVISSVGVKLFCRCTRRV